MPASDGCQYTWLTLDNYQVTGLRTSASGPLGDSDLRKGGGDVARMYFYFVVLALIALAFTMGGEPWGPG